MCVSCPTSRCCVICLRPWDSEFMLSDVPLAIVEPRPTGDDRPTRSYSMTRTRCYRLEIRVQGFFPPIRVAADLGTFWRERGGITAVRTISSTATVAGACLAWEGHSQPAIILPAPNSSPPSTSRCPHESLFSHYSSFL